MGVEAEQDGRHALGDQNGVRDELQHWWDRLMLKQQNRLHASAAQNDLDDEVFQMLVDTHAPYGSMLDKPRSGLGWSWLESVRQFVIEQRSAH